MLGPTLIASNNYYQLLIISFENPKYITIFYDIGSLRLERIQAFILEADVSQGIVEGNKSLWVGGSQFEILTNHVDKLLG